MEKILYRVSIYSKTPEKVWLAGEREIAAGIKFYDLRWKEGGPITYNHSVGKKYSDVFFDTEKEAVDYIYCRKEYELLELCRYTYNRVKKEGNWGVIKYLYYVLLRPLLIKRCKYYS